MDNPNNVLPFRHGQQVAERTYSPSQLALIRQTVAKDCNSTEFDLFAEVAKRAGLDPFRKQIYAFVFSKDDPNKRQLAIVTGIDGYRVIAQRAGDYRPSSEPPTIQYDENAKDPDTNPLGIVRAYVTAHKLGPDGNWFPVAGEAYWDEFVPLREIWEYDEGQGRKAPTGRFEIPHKNKAWRTMPRLMIAKCAEAQALRRGWPEGLSGIYTQEEMDQAISADMTATEMAEAYNVERRLALTKSDNAIGMLWAAGEPIENVQIGEIADRCMAFIGQCESATQLEAWRDTNRVGLQEFWARNKSDALEVKKALENRIAALSETQE